MKKLKIGVGAVGIGDLEKKYVLDVLEKNRLSYGPYTEKFEKKFAKLHARKYALFTSSGTSALQVAFHGLKKENRWKDGAEVIVPALTFVASINTILQNNLRCVFVDIEPNYFGIDPAKIEEKITEKTVAIEPVHLFGQPAQMDKIKKIAQRHSLKIVEDSCETMFAKHKGKIVGSWGDVSCFSTYSAHLIVTGVGGFATTDNFSLARKMKSLFNHGRDDIYISIDDDNTGKEDKLEKIIRGRFNFVDIGYSYRGTELEGAIGLGQLAGWREMIAKRKKNASYLTSKLSSFRKYIRLPKIRPGSEHVFMVYPIVLKDDKIDIFDLVFFLEKAGIETRFLLPTLSQPIYKKIFGDIQRNFPVAKKISERGFYIGCHQELSKTDLDFTVEKFSSYFRNR